MPPGLRAVAPQPDDSQDTNSWAPIVLDRAPPARGSPQRTSPRALAGPAPQFSQLPGVSAPAQASRASRPSELSAFPSFDSVQMDSSDTIFRSLQAAQDLMLAGDVFGAEPSKKHVTISFEEAGETVTSSKAPSDFPLAHATLDSPLEDLYVCSYWVICSTFAHFTDGCIDHDTEAKFARSKDERLRGAFVRVSFLMLAGATLLASWAGYSGEWLRSGIYACVVAPPYGMYGCLAQRFGQRKQTVSGSRLEHVVVGAFGLQGLAIVAAEWLRPKVDYGMLVMHIGFVQNFTPFRELTLHLVTALACLLPFSLATYFRYKDPALLRNGSAESFSTGQRCGAKNISVETDMILDLLMPTVILLSQVFSTSKRDLSMREDFLVTEQLQSQKKLLKVEKKRCEDLLRSLLPRQIIASALQNDPVAPQFFPDVTVIFIEICGFHGLCAQLTPGTVVELLNVIYHEFDRLSDLLDVYKVETVGEVYMAVVGCPEMIVNHADVAAHFALAAQQSMLHLRGRLRFIAKQECDGADETNSRGSADNEEAPRDPAPPPDPAAPPSPPPPSGEGPGPPPPSGPPQAALPPPPAAEPAGEQVAEPAAEPPPEERPAEALAAPAAPPAGSAAAAAAVGDVGSRLQVRIGLNSGKIRAGVVGLAAPRYKLVGDTVNTASRMESTCVPGRIQVSPSTQEKLTDGIFVVEPRGEIPVKGKGTMSTSFLNGYAEDGGAESVGPRRPRQVLIRRSSAVLSDGPDRTETSDSLLGAGAWRRDGDRAGEAAELPARSALQTWMRRHVVPDDNAETIRQRPGRAALSRKLSGIDQLLLLASDRHKQPDRLALLQKDLPRYLDDMLPVRVYNARVLTIGWLLIVTVISVVDYFLQEGSRQALETMLVRSVCNDVVGLLYLLLTASEDHDARWVQAWTIIMLLIQGVSVLFGRSLAFQGEPSLVALYGVCVLFYSVCSVLQRLSICVLAVACFMATELARCDGPERFEGVLEKFMGNVVFLGVFFVFMACSVRLEEFLGHVANYDHCFMDKQLEMMDQARSASSQLLASLLPEHVAHKVLEGVSPIAEPCEQATMLFTDIKGFTAYAANLTPQELVDLLNSMYSAFDEIIVSWELYKVEIIGDAYFVTAGCPPPENPEDRVGPEECAMRAVEVGLAMLRTLPTLPWGSDGTQLEMRVGLHTGSVVAGVVGKKGPRYHLFGAAVGYASQMESTGQPGRVHISDETYGLLRAGGYSYDFEETWVEVEGLQERARTWNVNKSKDRAAQKIQTKLLRQRASKRNFVAQEATAAMATQLGGDGHAGSDGSCEDGSQEASCSPARSRPGSPSRSPSRRSPARSPTRSRPRLEPLSGRAAVSPQELS